MSRITLAPNASGTGTLTVAAPNTNTDYTLTLPDLTGTVVVNQGSGAFVIDSSGNVGIGVSNPEDYRDFGPAPALVFGNTTGSSQATIVSGTASEGNLTFADGTTGNDSYRGMIRYNHSSDYMALFIAATERMRIDSSGNVGIGTSSPGAKLEVSSTASAGRILLNAADLPMITNGYDKFTSGAYNGAGRWGMFMEPSQLTLGCPTAGAFTFKHFNADSTSTERMRIDGSGNVSITQTPGKYTVDVSGGATSIANGGTVDFANASGMLVVNNHSSGAISLYLCGGGGTTLTGTTGTQVGTFAYVAGISGYRWTNNFGSTATFGFFFVRTRTTA